VPFTALALRNLLRQKRRTTFLAAAVAIGFAVVVILLGFSDGLVSNLKSNLSHAFGGQVFVKAEEWNQYGKIVSKISQPGQIDQALEAIKGSIQSFSRRSTVESTVVFGSRTARVSLSGVEWDRENNFRANLVAVAGSVPTSLGPDQILLNADTAFKLGASVGDDLLVKFKTLDGQQNVLDFTVAAVIKTAGGGLFSQDSYLTLSQANQMLGLGPLEYQALNIYLKDMSQQEQVAQSLEKTLMHVSHALVSLRADQKSDANPMQKMLDQMLGENADTKKWIGSQYSVSILDDFMSNFVSLISAIQGIALVIFLIMTSVTVIGISNTFRMILQERTVEIGTLRALGLRQKGILILFLEEAVAVMVLGLLGGGLIALVIEFLLSGLPLGGEQMASMFLLQGHLSFQPGILELMSAILIILASGTLAAWSPARKASKLFPADALRHRG
jgi:putative ABC transport system permease protein